MKNKTTQGFLSLILGLALSLAAAELALAKGGGGGGGGGGGPCDVLLDTVDGEFDGFSDLEECLGLTQSSRSVGFSYPGCLTTPAAAPDCLDPTVRDLFLEIHRDATSTGTSAYDEDFGGLGPISDAEIVAALEAAISAGGLGVNIHVVPPGSFLAPADRPRGVVERADGTGQSGITLIEDRSLGFARDGSGNLICPDPPPPTGFTFQGNPNEYGTPQVLSQRIFDRLDCLFGNLQTPGNFAEKRAHLINTARHELGHTIEGAPDASNHTNTGEGCIMDAAIEVDRQNRITIPTLYCGGTQTAVRDGVTASGHTVLCGDNNPFDGDDGGGCITSPEP